ncbi:MAG: hypothetical protein K0Q72_944 [Armatimonadetes bacterium]|nr:hypothetical protein [Armatimonadota bacterium]
MESTKPVILVINDDEPTRYSVSRILERAGYHLRGAGSGEDGLRSLADARPDLVVLDIHLPGISGFEVCRRIKSNPETAAIPVLYLTGSSGPASPQMADFETGGDSYLTHPVEPPVLVATVRALLRLYQAMSDRQRARAAQQESEETFRALFENAMDAILIADDRSAYVDVNPAGCELLGRTREELLGASLTDVVPPELQGQARLQWDVFLREGHQEGVFELRRADGSTRLVEFRARANFRPGLHLSVLRDITARTRTEEELRASHRQLKELSNHLQGVREEERARIAREVHDELGQALTGLKLEIAAIVQSLPARNRTLIPRLKSMADVVDGTVQSVRRISTELRPVILDELGLVPAIEWFASSLQRRTGIACRVTATEPEQPHSPEISVALFRIVQEAFTNVARHAQATAVSLSLEHAAGTLTLSIHDNGSGIGADQVQDWASVGLAGMRERAAALGGELSIASKPGEGTTIMVAIPLMEEGRVEAPGIE